MLSYVCPYTLKSLKLREHKGGKYYINEEGTQFVFEKNIPNFIYPKKLSVFDTKVKQFYDDRAENYDKYLHLTFFTHSENEKKTRECFIDLLNIKKEYAVLEIAAGTGRDSELIAEKLGKTGKLFLTDISQAMLEKCVKLLENHPIEKKYCLSNAAYLPYPNKSFDAVYSFGAVGEFGDIKKSLQEMVRVTKVGGKIVIGDESMPPWLRETYFSRVLTTTNPQFSAELPLDKIPVEARNLNLRWVIGGVFYLIDFEVGKEEPIANFDFEIPGVRGGTYRTRFEGQLEGVTPETKKLAFQVREKLKISMHKWLDDLIKNEAKRILGED